MTETIAPRRLTLLPPVSGSAALNEILDDPGALARVRELPGVTLHRLICAIGLDDSLELLALATPHQVREVLDLQLWEGDRLLLDEALEWLHLLSGLPDDVRTRDMAALDIELIGLVLLRHMRIYLAQEDELPEEPEGPLDVTPDGWFALEILAPEETTAQRVRELVERLYEDDADAARRMLQNLMWELPAELEDWSYRWRHGRLLDMGFADPEDALRIHAHLDPGSVHIDEGTADRSLNADPEPLTTARELAVLTDDHATAGSFWSRAGARITDPRERERLNVALVAVSNRMLAADMVRPADTEAARARLDDLHWRLSVGLEQLCGGELERAPAVLRQVALLRISRVGHSLALNLRRELLASVRERPLGSRPGAADLLDPPLRGQIEGLLRPAPRYVDATGAAERAFHSLSEIAAARGWIERALLEARTVDALEAPDHGVGQATFGDRFRTLVVNRLLERDGAVDAPALCAFLRRFVHDGTCVDAVRGLATEIVGPGAPHLAAAWIGTLEDRIGGLDHRAPPDLRFVDGLCLAR